MVHPLHFVHLPHGRQGFEWFTEGHTEGRLVGGRAGARILEVKAIYLLVGELLGPVGRYRHRFCKVANLSGWSRWSPPQAPPSAPDAAATPPGRRRRSPGARGQHHVAPVKVVGAVVGAQRGWGGGR